MGEGKLHSTDPPQATDSPQWPLPRACPTAPFTICEEITMRHPFTRQIAMLAASFAFVAIGAATAAAQAKREAPNFAVGYTDIGPALGLGGIGGASASFGGRFETAIKALPEMGNGILGIEASFDYYSWSTPGYSFKYIPLGVT